MRLKWLLTKSKIQRVILIVDDVESLALPNQVAICQVIAKSFEWLINLTGIERHWVANAIISIRPLTYNALKNSDWFPALYFDDPIGVGEPADLVYPWKEIYWMSGWMIFFGTLLVITQRRLQYLKTLPVEYDSSPESRSQPRADDLTDINLS